MDSNITSEAAAETEIDTSVPEVEQDLAAQLAEMTAQRDAAVADKAALLARTMEVARKYASYREWCAVADEALREVDPSLAVPSYVRHVEVTLRLRLVDAGTLKAAHGRYVGSDGAIELRYLRNEISAAVEALHKEYSLDSLHEATIVETTYESDPSNPSVAKGDAIARLRRYRLGHEDGEMDLTILPIE